MRKLLTILFILTTAVCFGQLNIGQRQVYKLRDSLDALHVRINGKLNISDTSSALAPYLRRSDTTSMLSKYLRSSDAATTYATISNLALKVNISDTSTMLTKYLRKSDTTAMLANYKHWLAGYLTSADISGKLNISDTAIMLLKYLRRSDTTSMLSPYQRTSDAAATYATISNLALKNNISDTASMLSKYLRRSDTTTMLSPYLRSSDAATTYASSAGLALKVNISDTASMLSKYLRRSDTTAMLSPYYRTSDANVGLALKANIASPTFTGVVTIPNLQIPATTGLFLQGSTSQTAALEIFNVEKTETNLTALARPVVARFQETVTPNASGSFIDYHLIDANMGGSSANINVNTGFYAIEGTASPSAASVGKVVGVYGHGQYAGTGTLVEGYGLQGLIANSAAGTITNAAAIILRTPINSGGGTIGTNIGLKIEDQNVGTNKWAIKTGLGKVQFGDTTQFPTPFTLGSTSVTTTGTQLNYLNAATGTTGTTTTNLVYSTSPTLVTPTLGVATATSINKVAITAPASAATLTLVDGGSLITAGAFATTLTSTATTNATLPAGTNTLYSTLSGSITSAQLATSLTNETGTGVAVFGTSPDFTTGATIGSVAIPTISSINTLTNKRWTARVGNTTSSATPTINTDNTDIYKLTAQTADITSFTTNLSGTPVDGDILEIQITGTAARAITWGASFVASTIALPTTTVTTATLTVIFQYFTTSSYGTNKWVCANSF